MEKCKATYEALNSQLIEELPTLIEVATSIFLAVISEFILARKLFVGRITKELLTLMDVSTDSSHTDCPATLDTLCEGYYSAVGGPTGQFVVYSGRGRFAIFFEV